jgi:dipeptide/tripeptide permease
MRTNSASSTLKLRVLFLTMISGLVGKFVEKGTFPRWKSASWLFAENTAERFAYYGLRSVLILFLKDILDYSDDDATVW